MVNHLVDFARFKQSMEYRFFARSPKND